ncbi:MAG: type II toxin-antitoxin system HicB family antitoxin [Betaproteobacteria bacterium]|nr:type II toxin-antitoxin system HicB family antitoxin [Betaproteobacteria bacterium]
MTTCLTANLELDVGDNILAGRVLDVDDVIVFHVDSIAEFTQAFHEAVDGYIAACEKLGQTPENPASGKLMLRVDPVVHAAALKAATHSGQSLNRWAEGGLRQAAHA